MIDPTITLPAFKTLETAINLAARLLPEARQELIAQQGKVIELQCQSPDISVFIELGDPCRVLHHSDEVSAGLTGELGDWMAFVRADDRASELINGNLKLSGDSKWLMQLSETFGKLDLDWEDELANIIGDVPAHLIGTGGRQILATVVPVMEGFRDPAREIVSSALQSVGELLRAPPGTSVKPDREDNDSGG